MVEIDYFPYRKTLDEQRFAYVTPLTFGRARINVTLKYDPLGVNDFY